ncbi:MAG: methyltransferase family protein [Gemmatimonadales bacterium]
MNLYRQAGDAPATWNVTKTFASMVAVSLLLFWAIPLLIVGWKERQPSLDWLRFPGLRWPGIVLMAGGAVPFFWAAFTLALRGRGTPLPFDAPRQPVATGPYAWVRNPMVSAGLVQGIGAGLWFGSTLVMGFFVTLALVWNLIYRPEDERQLERVFGRTYVFYRRSVRCWLPHRRPWNPPEVTAPISIDEIPIQPGRRRR